ncbi:MAG TPA: 2-C-methyl-D-erythritol 4-phosphate cytidylyltransferase [Acidobacteriaceae bacterium]
MRVFVILPAAGLGTRMAAASGSGAPPKQFMSLAGVPILIHTLRAFAAVAASMYVAVRASERARLSGLLEEYRGTDAAMLASVHLVEGGDTRQESVAAALAALVAGEPGLAEDDVVLVHDAVRPLITPLLIERTIAAVVRQGAAIVAMPATDTIKQVERTARGARVTATIPRENIVQAQTPQGFRAGLLRRAFAEAAADGFSGTDEASVVERAGVEVAVVAGSLANMKITQPGDLELAEFFLARAGR